MTHLVIDSLEQFQREVDTFTAAAVASYRKFGLDLDRVQLRPDEYRFAVISPNGMHIQVNTVWYNAREKKAEYCEGPLRQYPPKDIK
ncbi:hypothetical protein AHP1_2161 [Aeromonas phage Ahp1_CNU-2021]|nr:hypothetical protein AHP1_2161 [Aeromonas phage Ahp1_CNU-2021]